MQSNLPFTLTSADPDNYTLSFTQTIENPRQIHALLTDAVFHRLNEIINENELVVLGLSVKLDCFEFSQIKQGVVEIDSLFHTESVSVMDAYLYDMANKLLAKASCTLQYEKTSRVPAY